MALSNALNAASAGLSVLSRRAELVSLNIANVATAGYVRRDLAVQSNAFASGPQVLGVTRQGDAMLTGDRRSAQAGADAADFLSARLLRIEQAFGEVGQGGSLTDAVNVFDAALVVASTSPGAPTSLAAVLETAQALTDRIRQTSATIQKIRGEADRRIASDVESLNISLTQIAELDRQIVAVRAAGRDEASLQDQRQILVDRVARIIPLREVDRPDGRPALIAQNGAVLLDGRPAEFGFTPTTVITASSTMPLSGLLLDGRPIPMGRESLVEGGTLGAAFLMRDWITVDAQQGLDEFAQNLALRLQAADTTVPAGQPGLFTDGGAAANPSALTGFASRLSVNSLADPGQGGDLRLLRDGFGAVAPGPISDGAGLLALHRALIAASPRSVAEQAADLTQRIAAARLGAEVDTTRAQARASTLLEAEAATGVNTDDELQDLLQIEKAYAANAKVLQVVDGLLQTLMEI
ncbi:flagellar hook-associated protein FlgK [Tabrizicola sp. M-4]|uniref:flagellar hook-associated protein FlgK n=1 Tax=Tabrizicola sp. M-4 TaxID=3055847 RepID=UPI003DAA14B1